MTINLKVNCHLRGFYSLFIETIRCIDYSVTNNYNYHIEWQANCAYSTSNENAFSQYFLNGKCEKSIYPPHIPGFSYHKFWFIPHLKRLHKKAFKNLIFHNEITQRLESLIKKDLSKCIGIHIRRTDHSNEIAQVPLSKYMNIIKKKLYKSGNNIFIATDCAITLKIFINEFGDRVIFNSFFRSVDNSAIHINNSNYTGEELGFQAIADAYMLSKCKEVILCDSNLSYSVLIMNPTIKYTLLVENNTSNLFIQYLYYFISNFRYNCAINNKFRNLTKYIFFLENRLFMKHFQDKF